VLEVAGSVVEEFAVAPSVVGDVPEVVVAPVAGGAVVVVTVPPDEPVGAVVELAEPGIAVVVTCEVASELLDEELAGRVEVVDDVVVELEVGSLGSGSGTGGTVGELVEGKVVDEVVVDDVVVVLEPPESVVEPPVVLVVELVELPVAVVDVVAAGPSVVGGRVDEEVVPLAASATSGARKENRTEVRAPSPPSSPKLAVRRSEPEPELCAVKAIPGTHVLTGRVR